MSRTPGPHPTAAPRPQVRPTGRVRRAVVVFGCILAAAAVVASCTPPSGPSDPVPPTCEGLEPTIRADGTVLGTEGPDVIVTGNGPDRVLGFGGDDVICTNGGEDVVDAGSGSDVVGGGAGIDACASAEVATGCEDDVVVGPVTELTVDRDADAVDDEVEQRFGTSPTADDTDGDLLSDRFEIRFGGLEHRPDAPDSDGDGLGDDLEDVDGDQLDAATEQAQGTDPLRADTDGDGVDDATEITRGFDPTRPDTDGDGLPDGVELDAGLDPTDGDSDGDGTADVDEVRQVTATAADGSASVSVTAPGILTAPITVVPFSEPELAESPGIVGQPVEIDLGSFDQSLLAAATVTLSYPTGVDPVAAAGLRVLTWDEDIDGWVPAGPLESQTVDPVGRTVTSPVDHFSTFALFDLPALQSYWNSANRLCQAQPGDPVASALDLAIVVDTSGSMSTNDPSARRVTESRRIIEALRPDDRVAVVGFSSSASVRYPLGGDRTAALAAANQLSASGGGTNIGNGVSAGLNQLAGESPDRSEVMLLFTDGQGSYSTSLTAAAVADGVKIYTVGLGSGVDATLLGGIASATGGEYYPIGSADQIFAAFQAILAGSDDTRDTDGDGLTDCEEQRGMPSASGRVFTSDPLVIDTDGDGLDDGYEIGEKQRVRLFGFFAVDAYFYDVLSDPSRANTDRDPDNTDLTKLDDLQEVALGSNPLRIDSDRDGLDDGAEWYSGLDLTSRDTDGDGIDDLTELTDPENLFLDPLAPDDVVTREEYLRLYGLGLLCGDLARKCADQDEVDSIPFLLGAIISGFVPVAGDARDLIGSAINGDLVGFGLNIVAVIPVVGDSARAAGKVVRTITRLPAEKLPQVLAIVRRLPGVPPGTADDIVESVIGGSLDVLRATGKVTEAGLDELVAAGVDVRRLARAVEGASDVRRAPGSGFLQPKQAEVYLREPGFKDRGHVLYRNPENPRDRTGSRVVDAWKPGPPKVAREAKVGAQRLSSRIEAQIAKDVRLRADGEIDELEWHFFPSEASRKIADDQALFDRLTEAGIPYVIHLP